MPPTALKKAGIALAVALSISVPEHKPTACLAAAEQASNSAGATPALDPRLGRAPLSVWFAGTQEAASVRARRNLVYEALIHEYSQQTRTPVAYEVRPGHGWRELIHHAAEDGSLPCVFELDAALSYELVENGWLAPIALPDDIKTDLIPSVLEQGSYRGGFYFAGLYDVGLGLWGNKALIEQANRRLLQEAKPIIEIPDSLDSAWTEAEFLYALRALKEVTSAPPMNIQLHHGPDSEWLTYGFLPIVQSYGGDVVDRTHFRATGILDGQRTINALKKLQDWIRSRYVAGPGESDSFEKGEAALSYVGTWKYDYAKAAIGEDNLVLIPMPRFGGRIVVGMGTWAWAIAESCPNTRAANEFIFFMLRPDNLRLISDRTGLIPARKTAARDSVLYAEQGKLHLLFQQILEFARPRPKTAVYPIITRNFRRGVYRILAEMEDVEILETIAATIDSEIASYHRASGSSR